MNLVDRLVRKIGLERRIVAGLISGTSADGVDVAIVELEGHGRNIKHRMLVSGVVPYPEDLRGFVLSSITSGSVRDICVLNFLVARFFSKAFKDVISTSNLSRDDVDLIGSHGQTIYHYPELVRCGGFETRCSLQVGSLQVIAEHTGVITVGNFRARDIAVGGHGAPIIAYVDYVLFTHPSIGRAIQNIGGIANVTVLPPNASLEDVYAFDTGPGNTLIDYAVSMLYRDLSYDPNGEIASRGTPDDELLEELMGHPYISAPPPKTTGREVFGREMTMKIIEKGISKGLSREDIVATLTMFTVKSIVYNYKRYILPYINIEEVIVGGGGTRNKTMMKWLEREFRMLNLKMLGHEDLGIDSKYKEALGMAVLAHETLSGIPNNVPRATGAMKRVVMGEIAL
ncbi:MAG: anhydro-N-acetylmuramic acid kinase [Sulfolobales archaeon]